MWVVYDHPDDEPDSYVARLWLTLPGAAPTNIILKAPTVDSIRDHLVNLGFVRLERSPGDDAKIMESWI